MKLDNYRHCPEPTHEYILALSLDLAEDAVQQGRARLAHKIICDRKASKIVPRAAQLGYTREIQMEILKTIRAFLLLGAAKSDAMRRDSEGFSRRLIEGIVQSAERGDD